MPQFSEEDEGKTVVNPVGDEVGIVQEVEDGVPYVKPNPDLTDKIKASLGWDENPGMSEYPLDDEHIEEVTEEKVQLYQDLPTDQSYRK